MKVSLISSLAIGKVMLGRTPERLILNLYPEYRCGAY